MSAEPSEYPRRAPGTQITDPRVHATICSMHRSMIEQHEQRRAALLAEVERLDQNIADHAAALEVLTQPCTNQDAP